MTYPSTVFGLGIMAMILQGCASNHPQAQPPQQSPPQASSSQAQAGSNSPTKPRDLSLDESRSAGGSTKTIHASNSQASSDHRSPEQEGVNADIRYKRRAAIGRPVDQAVIAGERDSQGTTPAASLQSARGQTSHERLAHLQRALDQSLSKFDGRLLQEREKLNQARSGGSTGTAMTGGSQVTEPNIATMSPSGAASGSGNQPKGAVATIGGNVSKGSPSGRVPPGIPDGHDDDIVARQLREAAQNEEDPALRKKLWQEYKDYKNGTVTQRR